MTLFSRKFARPVTWENKVHANISRGSIIVQEMNNRKNKVTRKISVLQHLRYQGVELLITYQNLQNLYSKGLETVSFGIVTNKDFDIFQLSEITEHGTFTIVSYWPFSQ